MAHIINPGREVVQVHTT